MSLDSDQRTNVLAYAGPEATPRPEMRATVKFGLFLAIVLPPSGAYAWAHYGTLGMRYRYREHYVSFPFWTCTGVLVCVSVFLIAQVIQRRWPARSLFALLAIFFTWVIFLLAIVNLCIWPQFSSNPGW